jgi:hypothetical protein
MHGSDKRNIPPKVAIKELHMIHHQILFTVGNTKKEAYGLQGLIPTQQIIPKLYLGSIRAN